MKEIKAIAPFAGVVSMAAGEIREVSDGIAADLVNAGYAEEIKGKRTQKKGDKDESE